MVHFNPNGSIPKQVINKRNARLFDNIKHLAEVAVGYEGDVKRSRKTIRESKHNP